MGWTNLVPSDRGTIVALFGGIKLPGAPALENIRRLDLMPMAMSAEMTTYGMAIDKEWFATVTEQLDEEMEELKAEICLEIPYSKLDEFIARSKLDETSHLPMNVESTDQIRYLMFDVLGIGRGRNLKLTKKGDKISTGKKQLEKLKRDHPMVQKVLDYRERSKLKGTYGEKLPLIAKHHPKDNCWCGIPHFDETWRIHSELLWTRTSTGRGASKNPNLQNIPARTELGRQIRRGFIASPGTEIVGCDYSQIEMRMGGHYSQDDNLLRIFRLGLDPHTDTAKRAFRVEKPDKLTQRDPCKNVNFGVFYGLAAEGLFDLMMVTYATAGMDIPDWLTLEWCDQFIKDWFKLYPGVMEYLEEQYYRARRYGVVWTLFGRIRRVPEVRSVHSYVQSQGLRQAGNMPIQGTCADIMRLAMAMVHVEVVLPLRKEGIFVRPLMTIHDELLLEVEARYGDIVLAMVEGVMSKVMFDKDEEVDRCAVPIVASGHVMNRWTKE